jgi:ribosomal protein S18 acetylase RimI-like enzyme
MAIEIRETGPEILAEYGAIPISFLVESVLTADPIDDGLGGIALREEIVEEPWVKDFDALEDEDVTRWTRHFDVSRWGFLTAVEDGCLVGGLVLAYGSRDVFMLDERDDLAVVWDLRVHPDHRRRGIGARLFRRAAAWACERECTQLKVETPSVDVPASRFYRAQGCRLGGIHRFAYARDPRVAGETQLLWFLDLV